MKRFRLMTAALILSVLFSSSLMTGCGSGNSSAKASWKIQYEQEDISIKSIYALDENNVWAVGTSGVILFFDGSSWNKQREPLKDVSSSTTNIDNLQSVYAFDKTHVWAVGDNGTILFFNGSSWNKQDNPLVGTYETLQGVVAMDEKYAWAVGTSGNILSFDGTVWASRLNPLSDNGQDLNGVSASKVNLTWAVGFGKKTSTGMILEHNGAMWKERKETSSWLNAVYALDDSHAWAVGGNGAVLFGNGDTWVEQSSGSKETLRGVWGIDANNVWAVGLNGTILNYNGTSWTSLQNPLSGTKKILTSVSATDESHIWAVGCDPSGGGGVILALSSD